MDSLFAKLSGWNQGLNDIPRKLLIIAGVIGLCYIAVLLFPYCWPFVLALIFASLMEPVARLFRKLFSRFKAAQALSTLLCMLIFFGLVIAIFLILSDKIIHEGINFVKTLPDLANTLVTSVTAWLNPLYEEYSYLLPEDFMVRISSLLSNFLSSIAGWAASVTGSLASITLSTVSSLPMVILCILFTIMGTFYLSYDKERIFGFFSSQFPKHTVERFRLIRGGVFTAIFGQVRAQIFISCVITIIIVTGLVIMRKPYALLLGILIGIADVLPVIGAGLFLNSWAIISLILADYYTAIGLFIIYLVTITTRQIIEPRIVGKQLGLYPLLTMMSMFAGYQLFGALGLIAGPMVANICRVTLDADAGKLTPDSNTRKPVVSDFLKSIFPRKKNK